MFTGQARRDLHHRRRGQAARRRATEVARDRRASASRATGTRRRRVRTPNRAGPHRQVTLVEREVIANVNDEYGRRARRGRDAPQPRHRGCAAAPPRSAETFRVGDVVFRGIKSCPPCAHLEKLTRPGVRAALENRGGLRAEIVAGRHAPDRRRDHRRARMTAWTSITAGSRSSSRGAAPSTASCCSCCPGVVGRVVFGKAGREPDDAGAAAPRRRPRSRARHRRDHDAEGTARWTRSGSAWARWPTRSTASSASSTPGLAPRSRLVSLVGGGAAAVGLLASRALADERVPRRSRNRFLTAPGSSRGRGSTASRQRSRSSTRFGSTAHARLPRVREVVDRTVVADREPGHERGAARRRLAHRRDLDRASARRRPAPARTCGCRSCRRRRAAPGSRCRCRLRRPRRGRRRGARCLRAPRARSPAGPVPRVSPKNAPRAP